MQRLSITCALWIALLMTDEIRAQIVSPELNDDRSVTFRLRAPEAESVTVQGIAGHPTITLSQGANGIWEGTSRPLPAELYSYSFNVDGTMMIDPSNRFVKKWLTCGSLVEVPGETPRLHEQTPVPHGTTHRHLYDSKSISTERGVYVYTPPDYNANDPDGYPTLILMHGYGDDESAWLEVGRANFIADNLLAQGRIRPTVIVMPYGHPLPIALRRDFDDYSAENTERMEADLFDDLMPFLEQHYALSADREKRAIVGLSMGGGQSLTIGLRHLDSFAYVGGFSSASPQGSSEEIAAQLGSLAADVPASNEQLKLLWIGCGTDDFLLERNRAFVKWLDDSQITHTYRETDGGHDWIVWRKYLAEFLTGSFGS